MKKKKTIPQHLTILILLVFLVSSCSKIYKAADLITNPSAKKIYERGLKGAPHLFELWEEQGQKALFDRVVISLPYFETGNFFPKAFPVYSYEVVLNPGERLKIEVTADSINTLVFLDLFKQKKKDSTATFELFKSAEYETTAIQKEIMEPGRYKVIIQPEIEANTAFQLKISKEPVYIFPVASMGNAAIQSFWGASRDAGKRSHEGIDIFASRGTPVVATTFGRVISTGNKGLGGKQVWIRDKKRGFSLYYAHLDSIIATRGMTVSPGDTLGLVGNTGNARTTPPHLHFGIYRGFKGAVNPMPFIFIPEEHEKPSFSTEERFYQLLVNTTRANLRSAPTTRSTILDTKKSKDTLQVLGRTTNWFHIRTGNNNSYVHESLVRPI